jgi:thiamine biosynthesis protein ThiS
MKVQVNGDGRTVEEGSTVLDLLETLDLKPAATVVERNGDILERASFGDTPLAEGDVIELVRFVGGG